MKRITDLERRYALEALDNEFATSKNSIFNNRLEKAFCELFGVKFSIGHVNGTCTMHTALAALGVKAGDEVIVPPLTMTSTALAVLHNNSIPVFADVDPSSFNITAAAIESCITPRTRAVITVALYGLSPDYNPILEVCRKYGIALIEDNAECFLGMYHGKPVGTFGHFASFSFQASKHLTAGEGGMLTTDDEELADKARKFCGLGYAGVSAKQGRISRDDIQDPQYSRHVTLGFNYRMSEVNAAVLLAQVERARELVDQRIRVAKLFDEAVGNSLLLKRQCEPQGYVNSYWAYSMVLNTDHPDRDWYAFRDLFRSKGGDGYYAAWKLSYNEPLFRDIIRFGEGVWQKYEKGLCPVAEYLQPRMIQLKTNYWEISEAEKQAEILARTIHEFQSR